MSDEYTPITVDGFKSYYGITPPAFDDGQVNVVVKAINDAKGGDALGRAIAGYDGARVRALTPPAYQPVSTDTFKGMFPENTKFDDGQVKSFLDFATEHKLGEGTVKAWVALDKARMEGAEKAADEAWKTQQTTWKGELEKDSLLTEGDGLEKNLAKTIKMIEVYGGEKKDSGDNEFQEMLKVTGLGDHPAMARFLMRVAKAVPGEGRPASGSPGGSGRSPAEILFDKT